MKKVYNSPAMLVVRVQSAAIISGSVPVSNQAVSNSQDIGFVKDNKVSNNHSVWDNDWSE